MIHERLLSPPHGGRRQLKSSRPFVPAALDLLNDADALSTSAAGSWTDQKWNTPRDSIVSLPTSVLCHRECISPDPLGSGLIASEPALAYSAQQCINGEWLPHRHASVERVSRLQTA